MYASAYSCLPHKSHNHQGDPEEEQQHAQESFFPASTRRLQSHTDTERPTGRTSIRHKRQLIDAIPLNTWSNPALTTIDIPEQLAIANVLAFSPSVAPRPGHQNHAQLLSRLVADEFRNKILASHRLFTNA